MNLKLKNYDFTESYTPLLSPAEKINWSNRILENFPRKKGKLTRKQNDLFYQRVGM